MSTRVVVALHVAWMVVIVGLALWAGWLFRFEGDRDLYYLDRWTGELVENTESMSVQYRYSLRRAVQKGLLVEIFTEDPEGVLTRRGGGHDQSPPAPRANAFEDLIPK